MDVLPTDRLIAIRGDVVKTLRLTGGWNTPGEFAEAVGLSEDRIAKIEKGITKVYKKTLISIAKTLNVNWAILTYNAELETPVEGNIAFDPIAGLTELAKSPDQLMSRILSKYFGDDELNFHKETSDHITIKISHFDLLKLMVIFCSGKFDDENIASVGIQPDENTTKLFAALTKGMAARPSRVKSHENDRHTGGERERTKTHNDYVEHKLITTEEKMYINKFTILEDTYLNRIARYRDNGNIFIRENIDGKIIISRYNIK